MALLRPKSAKPGAKMPEVDDSMSDYEVIREKTEGTRSKQQRMLSATHQNNTRKIRPIELTTSEFARIMPKNIYQDKERLYGEALQLKQNMHGVLDENTKLKTKIAILEKENEKLLLRKEAGTYDPVVSKMRMYSTNGGSQNSGENAMVAGLKKMLREARDEVAYLKEEGQKLKKAVKYTKISELEVENSNLLAELSRLQKMIDELIQTQNEQVDYQTQIEQLEAFLKAKIEENQHLINTNKRISNEIDNLEEVLKATQTKAAEKQKKLLKDLDLARRRLADSQKQLDYLKGQLLKQRQQKQQQQLVQKSASNNNTTSKASSIAGVKPKSTTPAAPASNEETTKLMKQIEELKKQNEQLAQKIKQQQNTQDARAKTNNNNNNNQQKNSDSSPPKYLKTEQKTENKNNNAAAAALPSEPAEEKSSTPRKNGTSAKAHQKTNQSQDYGEDFDNDLSPEQQREEIETRAEKVQQPSYKEDFADGEDEEILFQKQEQSLQKNESAGSQKKKKKAGSAKKGKSSAAKSPMAQISELLTFRMRGQRYPFDELRQDIMQAGEPSFKVYELQSMLQNSPFFLNEQQTITILKYFMEAKNKPLDPKAYLDVQVLIEKLRKVIKDFKMHDEEEEEEMYIRIAQMVTTYASELESAFEQKKNGEGTISKSSIENLFRQLQLGEDYIELIISELSLASQDMEHLNYFQFFKRFYVDENMQVREVDEEYQENQSNPRTINRHMIQEEQIQESEEGSRRSKRNLGSQSNQYSQRRREDSQEI